MPRYGIIVNINLAIIVTTTSHSCNVHAINVMFVVLLFMLMLLWVVWARYRFWVYFKAKCNPCSQTKFTLSTYWLQGVCIIMIMDNKKMINGMSNNLAVNYFPVDRIMLLVIDNRSTPDQLMASLYFCMAGRLTQQHSSHFNRAFK